MIGNRLAPSLNAIGQEILNPIFRPPLVEALGNKGLSIEGVKIRTMRRRPASRQVFSCELIASDQETGKQSSIGLICKRDTMHAAGKGAREFEAMRLLWNAGFGLDSRFRIPQPVQHFPDLDLILQEKAHGSKLRSFLGKGTEVSLGYACVAGLWLAKLHNLKVSSPETCTYADEIGSLRTFVSALTTYQPKMAAELEQLASVLEHRFATFEPTPTRMVHGDFHPDHIFVGRDFITVIDFERFCLSDPARDLGSFIAHMRTTACFCGRGLDAVNHEIGAFLGSYFSAVPFIEGITTAQRIAPYVALSSLEALYYVACVLKVVDSARISIYVKCLQDLELRATESFTLHLAARIASA
jgi:hypothetical protein